MKLMNKTLFAVVALFGVTSVAFGYDFKFTNKTNKPVAVKLNLVASMADFDGMAVVMPGEENAYTFSFKGLKSGFCLKQILYGAVTEVKQNYPSFVEAESYTSVAASKYALNVCQSLSFDINDQYGGGLVLFSASK